MKMRQRAMARLRDDIHDAPRSARYERVIDVTPTFTTSMPRKSAQAATTRSACYAFTFTRCCAVMMARSESYTPDGVPLRHTRRVVDARRRLPPPPPRLLRCCRPAQRWICRFDAASLFRMMARRCVLSRGALSRVDGGDHVERCRALYCCYYADKMRDAECRRHAHRCQMRYACVLLYARCFSDIIEEYFCCYAITLMPPCRYAMFSAR